MSINTEKQQITHSPIKIITYSRKNKKQQTETKPNINHQSHLPKKEKLNNSHILTEKEKIILSLQKESFNWCLIIQQVSSQNKEKIKELINTRKLMLENYKKQFNSKL